MVEPAVRMQVEIPVVRFNPDEQGGSTVLGKMFVDGAFVGDIVLLNSSLGSVMPWLKLVSEVENVRS